MNGPDYFTSQSLPQLIKGKPLIICDVDEVVLHFVEHFENILTDHGLALEKTSLKLNGNVKRIDTKEPFEFSSVKSLVAKCHLDFASKQKFVEGSCESLQALSTHFQIAFLSNVEGTVAEQRVKYFSENELTMPFIANKGDKSIIVDALQQQVATKTYFIDDLLHHHRAIAKRSSLVTSIHFMADPSLRKLSQVENVPLHYADSWQDIIDFISNDYRMTV